jgi:hypothetical protein
MLVPIHWLLDGCYHRGLIVRQQVYRPSNGNTNVSKCVRWHWAHLIIVFPLNLIYTFLLHCSNMSIFYNYYYSKTCLNRTPLGLNHLFCLDRYFDLHRLKLHTHVEVGTVKCVWFRQVFGLLRVRFRQASL